ncbi:MAG: glycosyltransferase family 4 protein [bacterium]|nr:glycosyltransferase family 4 protein [bacterium]
MKSIGLIKTFPKRSGGNIYKQQVLDALTGSFEAEFVSVKETHLNKYLKGLKSFWQLFTLTGKEEAWIHDFYSTVFAQKSRLPGKHIALIFHVDFSEFPVLSRPVFTLMEKWFFYRNLRKMDAIVVISEYWKKYFEDKGFKSIYKAYCRFDLKDFDIPAQEVEDFKMRNHLAQKPVVYIGNCQKAKGVVEAYLALKGLDVHLVTSGTKTVDIPAMNFNGSYREYLTLLKACDVAVTMSKFKEGWCMTAHEAMLLKIPVIGSGKGGMKELLEGGKQIICPDFNNLRKEVEGLLSHPDVRKKMGEDGYHFAKDFTLERFKTEWTNIITKVL